MEFITSKQVRFFNNRTDKSGTSFIQVIVYFNNSCFCSTGYNQVLQTPNKKGIYKIILNVERNELLFGKDETPIVYNIPLDNTILDSSQKIIVMMSVEGLNDEEPILIGEVSVENVGSNQAAKDENSVPIGEPSDEDVKPFCLKRNNQLFGERLNK